MPLLNDQLRKAQEQLQSGDIEGAIVVIESILRRAPGNPDALCMQGMARLSAGDATNAVAPLERALQSDPYSGMALDSLGLAFLSLGRFSDAERVLRRAAGLPHAPAVVFMRLGMALLNLNNTVAAVQHLRRAVAEEPGNADFRLSLGQALYRAGDAAAARAQFDVVLRSAPAHADAMFNLGVVHLDQRDLRQAGAWFERAIQHAPAHAEAWSNLGVVREREQNFEAALECHRRALHIDMRLSTAAVGVARSLALIGRHGEAREQFLAALQWAPNDMAAREGLALTCVALGRLAEAIPHLRFVLDAEPENSGALYALSSALFETGQLADAEILAQRLIKLNPDAPHACLILANLLFFRGRMDEAITLLEDAYRRTGDGELLGLLTFQYRQTCDWPQWRDAWRKLAPQLEIGAALGSPFWLLCEPISAAQQLSYTRAWARARFGNANVSPPAAEAGSREGRRLRIGYLSSDFQEHAAAYLLADVIEHHDRNQFETFAYSHGPNDDGPMRRRLHAAFEHFVDIAWQPDDVAAARIRDDRIDILVELKGYTVGDRLTILARRPCAIQITWLGYPGTTGAPFIDYLIADPYLIPPGEESTCSEQVLRMPHCYQPNDRKRTIAGPLSRADYGLAEHGFVFCCFNQVYKITPDVFAVWMRLLQRVADSVLWLVDSNPRAQRNLLAEASSHGVDAQRLIFAPRRPYAEHLAQRIATDPAMLQGLRVRLEQARRHAPLFDSALFARDLEQLYRDVISH